MTMIGAPSSGAEAGQGAPSPYAWYVLSIFFLAAVLSYTDRLILNVLVDPIRQDLMISDTQVSLLQGAAFAIVYSIAGFPLGRWADQRQRRNLVVLGVIVWSTATGLCAIAQTFWGLFLSRMLVGVGEAALAPAVLSMIADYFPPHRRGTAIGIFIAGMIMGAGVALMAGGYLLSFFQVQQEAGFSFLGVDAPWRQVLLALGLFGFVVAALFLTVREPRRQDQVSSGSFGDLASYFSGNASTFILLLGGLTLIQIVDYGLNSWMPSLLIRNFDFTPTEVGATLGLILIGVAGFGTVIGGLIADALQNRGHDHAKVLVCGVGVALATPCLLFGLLSEVDFVLWLYGAYAFLFAMSCAAGLAAIQDVVPSEMRGMTTAVQACLFTMVGLGLGPTIIAIGTDHVFGRPTAVGWSMTLVGLPILAISSLAILISIKHFRGSRQRLLALVKSRAGRG